MKLSIITINYNNRSGLHKTIKSVLSQTYSDFEYIIIDGASTDGSVDVIKSFKEKISFWISEPDNGVYNAMNKGILRSNGDYLLFLNSGDFLVDENVLTKVFENLITEDIVSARCFVTKDNQIIWTSPLHNNITFGTLYYVGLNHQSTFIKRELFFIYGLYDENYRYNADIEFWYRTIINNNVSTQSVDVIMTYYNLEGISEVDKEKPSFKKEHELILSNPMYQKIIPDYEKWRTKEDIIREYSWINKYYILRKFIKLLHTFMI